MLYSPTSGNDEYDALPECIRYVYTVHEWLWMTDAQKADLLRRETDPTMDIDYDD